MERFFCSDEKYTNNFKSISIFLLYGASLPLDLISCSYDMQVRDKGIWLSSYKDVRKFRRVGIVPSMFPSGKNYVEASDSTHDTTLGEMPENNRDSVNESQSKENKTSLTDDLEEEISNLPLEYCMRIVPHDQNSGAFFIAVFQKLSPLPGNLFSPSKFI